MTMKILTWNINGIRASKRCLKDVFDSLDADVICLQETKITRDMLDEPTAIVEGYNAYFSFSRKRSGYSGTANVCRDRVIPVGAEEGLSGQLVSQSEGSIGCYGNVAEFESEELTSLDGEGRAVITQHQIELQDGSTRELVIINVYVPRAADLADRLTYKLRFLALLQSRAESLLRNGRHVVVLGDMNTTHKRIDHCDPSSQEYLRLDSRQWMDQFLRPEDRNPDLATISDKHSFEAMLSDAEGGHFIDTFRFLYPDKEEAYTNWCTVTSARQTNYGRRLDYIFVDKGLKDHIADCQILADFQGSDHCPVVLELQCKPVPAKKCPPLCTKFMPEFQGKQQKLLSFFSKPNTSRLVTDSEEVPCDQPSGIKEDFSENLPTSEILIHQFSADSSSGLPTLQSRTAENAKKSPPKGNLKRALSDKTVDNSRLKKKKNGKKDNCIVSNLGSKQSSLFNFFQKPLSTTVSNSSAGQGDNEVTISKYWVESSEHDSLSSPKLKSSPLWVCPEKSQSSPSKLNLPSLTLIPCQNGSIESSKNNTCSLVTSVEADSEVMGNECSKNETLLLDSRPPTESSELSESTPEVSVEDKPKASSVWKGLLSGPPPPPLCKGHREACVLRTVKKVGPNKGKQFYVCARPEGHSSNKEARCDHFQWVSYMTSAGRKT